MATVTAHFYSRSFLNTHLPKKLHLTHKSLNHTMSGMSYIVTPEYRRVTTYTKTNTPTNTNNVYYRLGDLE